MFLNFFSQDNFPHFRPVDFRTRWRKTYGSLPFPPRTVRTYHLMMMPTRSQVCSVGWLVGWMDGWMDGWMVWFWCGAMAALASVWCDLKDRLTAFKGLRTKSFSRLLRLHRLLRPWLTANCCWQICGNHESKLRWRRASFSTLLNYPQKAVNMGAGCVLDFPLVFGPVRRTTTDKQNFNLK